MKSPKKSSAKKAKKAKKGRAKSARRNIGPAIENLDVSSMHSDDVTDVMLHLASALKLKKAMASPNAAKAKAAGYCYTKAGDSSTVSIWSGGFKVGESSEAEAQAQGIPPCG